MRWLVLLLLMTGCVEPREASTLVDHGAWELSSADPWPDHAPDPIECGPLAWSAENSGGEPSLEVRTDDCNYLVVEQPTLAELLPGDQLQFRLWHFDLIQFEPATGHAALSIGGVVYVDEEIAIPGEAEMIIREVFVDEEVPAGAPVVFHLHNHGANTWNLVEISGNPPETLTE